MTRDTQQREQGGAGSGRHGGGRSRRRWLAVVALLGLGAIGGALATIAVDADAHGGWRHAMSGFRHHGHAADPDRMIERLQRKSARVLGSVDATDEQREQIDAILAGTVEDVFALRTDYEAHRRDLIAELARPQIDRAALERVRAAKLALADRTSSRLVDTVVALAEVLEPEQRQRLIERFQAHRH